MNKHKSFGFFSVFDRKKKNRKPKPKLFGFGTEIFGPKFSVSARLPESMQIKPWKNLFILQLKSEKKHE